METYLGIPIPVEGSRYKTVTSGLIWGIDALVEIVNKKQFVEERGREPHDPGAIFFIRGVGQRSVYTLSFPEMGYDFYGRVACEKHFVK